MLEHAYGFPELLIVLWENHQAWQKAGVQIVVHLGPCTQSVPSLEDDKDKDKDVDKDKDKDK